MLPRWQNFAILRLRMGIIKQVFFFGFLLLFFQVHAAQEPVVGRKAAQKYFQSDKKRKTQRFMSFSGTRYFNIHYGRFTESTTYSWGEPSTNENEQVGTHQLGVTYLLGSWADAMDLSLRLDFMKFDFGPQKNTKENKESDKDQQVKTRPLKMAILTFFSFPRFETGFPVYLGFAVGPGVFYKQLDGYSSLTLDYQAVLGVRLINVWRGMGLFVETGVKNHVHVLTKGQFDSLFLSAGTSFTF